jgi:hypothetical protein
MTVHGRYLVLHRDLAEVEKRSGSSACFTAPATCRR